jgi:hypothetical protein
MTGKYQTMPALAEDDRDALERSIRTHGIQVPIIVDENGDIIDGHHRREIADRLHLDCPVIHEMGKSEAEKIALSISLNVDRRQLTREQKREVISASIKAEPELSNREHARRTGADDKTVAVVRDDLASRAEIPHVSERTDSLGRQQPASKPIVSITSRKSESITENFDAVTGEVIEPAHIRMQTPDQAYVITFMKAMSRADDFLGFDAERLARLDSEATRAVDHFRKSVISFHERMQQAAGLRVIQGGK